MRIFNPLILLILLALPLHAQQAYEIHSQLEMANPGTVGMSVERLGRLDQKLQAMVAAEQVPGAVALVARNGKIVLYKAYGNSDAATGEEMKRDDIFRIASQTKAITSTAVMMLWEEGHFRLDDPIAKYIAEFEDAQVLETFNEADSSYIARAADKPITIRHLLTHTSGIGYGTIDGDPRFRKIYQKAGIIDAFTTENVTIEKNIKKLAKLPLHHDPGTGHTYSEGLDVLGYLVEIISGKPFNEFLRERLFDPIGMDDTWFYLPSNKVDRLVRVQRPTEEGWENVPPAEFETDFPIKGARKFYSGGAGLSSTAMDYARFLQMYLNKGRYNGERFLSRTTVNTMMENQVDTLAGKFRGHGLAFGLLNDEAERIGGMGSSESFDWGGYFNTLYFADPEENIIGILLKQTVGQKEDTSADWFRRMVFAAIDD